MARYKLRLSRYKNVQEKSDVKLWASCWNTWLPVCILSVRSVCEVNA
jgi:hypothetical protein